MGRGKKSINNYLFVYNLPSIDCEVILNYSLLVIKNRPNKYYMIIRLISFGFKMDLHS